MQSFNVIWRCKNSSIRIINLISKYRLPAVHAVSSSHVNVLRYSQISEKGTPLPKQRANQDVNDRIIKPKYYHTTPLFSKLSDKSIKDFLTECGLENSTECHITDAKSIMSQTIVSLKQKGLIPSHRNVPQYMVSQIKDIELNIDDCALNDSMTLQNIRSHILSLYLTKLLQLTNTQRDYMLNKYPKIKSKTFGELRVTRDIFIKELDMDARRKCHRYFLCVDNENLRKIIDIGSIGGLDIRLLLTKCPFVMTKSAQSIKDVVEVIKAFGISETAIPHCLEILKLMPQLVHFRLTELSKIEEFNVFRNHPRALRLVANFQTAKIRLQCLKMLPCKQMSLDILTRPGDERFMRIATQGPKKVHRLEKYLSEIFNRSVEELQGVISRQPNWRSFSIIYMKCNIDYLMGKGFSKEEICENMYIILYPKTKIDEFLEKLEDESLAAELDINISQLNNSQRLRLCAYLIEAPFGFSGDGVWPDQSAETVDEMDVDELRDFMNRLREQKKNDKQE